MMKKDIRLFLHACRKVDAGIEREFQVVSEVEGVDFREFAVAFLRGAEMGRMRDALNFFDYEQVDRIDRFVKILRKSLKYVDEISSQYFSFSVHFTETSNVLDYKDVANIVISQAEFAKVMMLEDSMRLNKLKRGRRPSHVEDLCLAALAKLFRDTLGSKESSFEYAGRVANHYYDRRGGALSASSMRKKLAKFQGKRKDFIKIENSGLWIQDYSRNIFDIKYPHKLACELNDFEKAASFLAYPLCYRKNSGEKI